MKRFNKLWCFFLSAYSFYAYADLGTTDCSVKGSAFCGIFLKMDRGVDDVSYNVELVDNKSGKVIFPYSDTNEMMESVSLQKYGGRYVFSKEYLDSSKSIEFITFKYDNKSPSSIKYYYIESFIDLNYNVKKWSGKECDTSVGHIPEKKDSSLLQAASALCVNQSKLAYISNENSEKDIIFYLSQFTDGKEKKQLPLIALDRKGSDTISLNDIGCLGNCDIDSDTINYIGKINKKFRVGLHLEYNGNKVFGFYFYEKNKVKINVFGRRNGDELILSTSVLNGVETFDGLLKQGQFKGMWSNSERNEKYPFTFYMMLIQ